MLIGLGVLILGFVAVGVISNFGRISSDKGNQITNTQYDVNRRNACITDLRNDSDSHAKNVAIANARRLAVLDGYDPSTEKKIVGANEEEIEATQKLLAEKYTVTGLQEAVLTVKTTLKLQQPTLNELCGEPIVEETPDKEE